MAPASSVVLSASNACVYAACSPPLSAPAPPPPPSPAPPAPFAPDCSADRRRSRSAYRSRCCLRSMSLLFCTSSSSPRSWRICASIASRRCDSCSRPWLTCSTRPRRSSTSLSLTTVGSGCAGVDSQPASASVAIARHSDRRSNDDILATSVQIDDVDASIAPPGLFRVPGDRRPLLAIAHGRDLRVGHTLQRQRPTHRLRASLAEANVVFARAALIGIALQPHPDGRVCGQVARVSGDQAVLIGLDLAAVEVEINRPILQLRARWAGHTRTGTAGNSGPIGPRSVRACGLGFIGRHRSIAAGGGRARLFAAAAASQRDAEHSDQDENRLVHIATPFVAAGSRQPPYYHTVPSATPGEALGSAVLAREWSPHRFSHLALIRLQPLRDQAVDRHG